MSDRESIAQDARDYAMDIRRAQAAHDRGEPEEVETVVCADCASEIDPTEVMVYDGQSVCATCAFADSVEVIGAEVDRIGASHIPLDQRWEAFETLEQILAGVKSRLMREQSKKGRH